MTDFSFEQAGHIGLLHFSGDLTEQCVERLRQGFIASLEHSDFVVVNLRNVTGLDARCFRLFCTAYRIFSGCNKRLFLLSQDQNVFSYMDNADKVDRYANCVSKCRDGCLWSRQNR